MHDFQYALVYVVSGVCALRYDNEAGKGDHKHEREREQVYAFRSSEHLLADFWNAVDAWRPQ
ncbi:toxin-antitoxin system TumE family protein [Caulobacter sp. DWR2-3-1b2]|uniref:toxin-antitoxin system TumE family protein n=1 Tax=Caulobacter sp. DWR2-3-1b2 TaxID=2804642 RepID=UPI003CF9BF32